jgi:hypothetical protein
VTDVPSPAATLKAMAKQSKKPADLNRLAAAIVGDATDDKPKGDPALKAAPKKSKKGKS